MILLTLQQKIKNSCESFDLSRTLDIIKDNLSCQLDLLVCTLENGIVFL